MHSYYTPEEIARLAREFEAANRRDHLMFLLGSAMSAALLVVMFAGLALFVSG